MVEEIKIAIIFKGQMDNPYQSHVHFDRRLDSLRSYEQDKATQHFHQNSLAPRPALALQSLVQFSVKSPFG